MKDLQNICVCYLLKEINVVNFIVKKRIKYEKLKVKLFLSVS
jgi:hypothetical protein